MSGDPQKLSNLAGFLGLACTFGTTYQYPRAVELRKLYHRKVQVFSFRMSSTTAL